MKQIGIMLTLTLSLAVSQAFADTSAKVTKRQAAATILAAIEADKKVNKVGFAWRDTFRKFIGPAKRAYRKGKYSKAHALATQAIESSEIALQQYNSSRGARLIK